METGIGIGIGLIIGISLWFPYKHHLNTLVKKKREASEILKELALSDQEHMQWYDFGVTKPSPGAWTNPYTTTTQGYQYGTTSTAAGTFSPSAVSANVFPAQGDYTQDTPQAAPVRRSGPRRKRGREGTA